MPFRKKRITFVWLVAIGFLLLFQHQLPAADSVAKLMFTTHTANRMVGTLNSDASTIKFESRMTTPAHARVQVRVNDLVLDASAQLNEKVRILDGHGHALSARDREALVALSKELEQRLKPYQQDLPPHEDFLVRVVLYWSEAPVGFPLTRQEVRP